MVFNSMQLDKQKKILIVIIAIFIVYVDLTYILKAQLSGLKNVSSKITRLEKDLKNLNRDLENMRISKNKPVLEARQAAARPYKVINENQVSGLLQDIASEANKFDVKIVQIRPGRDTGKTASPADKFTPILVNLDLICDYYSLSRFIDSLEKSLVLMGVAELKISTRVSDYLKQKVILVLKTYVTK